MFAGGRRDGLFGGGELARRRGQLLARLFVGGGGIDLVDAAAAVDAEDDRRARDLRQERRERVFPDGRQTFVAQQPVPLLVMDRLPRPALLDQDPDRFLPQVLALKSFRLEIQSQLWCAPKQLVEMLKACLEPRGLGVEVASALRPARGPHA